MKQKLQARISQHFSLTPQLQQSIKLLQLSSMELNEEIERMLEENPLLERLDDPLSNTARFQGDGSMIRQQSAGPGDHTESAPINAQENGLDDSSYPNSYDDMQADFQAEDNRTWEDRVLPDRQPDDEKYHPQLEAPPVTLKDHLISQMRVNVHDHRQRALVRLLIDALDSNGYLIESLEEMLAWLPDELAVSMPELE